MTVTAPFDTTEGVAARTQSIKPVDSTPLRRDPVAPFILVGLVTLVAIIALGFLLSTPI